MVEIRGIDDEDAGGTLREVLERSTVSDVRFVHSGGCDPVWDDLTDLAVFDRELKRDGVRMVWARICLPPVTFLRLQAAASQAAGHDFSAEEFLTPSLPSSLKGESILEGMVKTLEAGERAIPIPFIELDREGRIRGFQEGRTRAMAAYYAGVDQMPALVFLNTRKDDGRARLDPPSEFELQAVLDREAPEADTPGDFADEIRRRMGEADNTIWIEAVIGQQQPVRAGDFDEVSGFIEEQAGVWAESMTQRPNIDRVFCVTGEDRPEPRQPFTVAAANRVHCFIGFDTDEMTTRQADGLRKGIRRRFRGEAIGQNEPPGVASFRDFEEVNVVSEDVIAAVDPGLAGPPIEDVEFIE